MLDRPYSGLELERGGDAVTYLEVTAERVLTMCVQIDEARCDDVAGNVDNLSTLQRFGGDGSDAPSRDADVVQRRDGGFG